MINVKLLKGNVIDLNRDNNKESTQQTVAIGDYTYVSTSLEIALSKKFKKNIFDQNFFIDWLCLFVVNEIHLVKEWGNQFRFFYTKIKKVWKRIPTYISFMAISLTMTPNIWAKVIYKVAFLPNYKLIQTFLIIQKLFRFINLWST